MVSISCCNVKCRSSITHRRRYLGIILQQQFRSIHRVGEGSNVQRSSYENMSSFKIGEFLPPNWISAIHIYLVLLNTSLDGACIVCIYGKEELFRFRGNVRPLCPISLRNWVETSNAGL